MTQPPAPRPRPGPGPTPAPPPESVILAEAATWGRVDSDGSVWVRTGDEERRVGQWPGGDAGEALALYARRYAGLAVEVDLLERRVRAGALSPDQARTAVASVRRTVTEAQAVGNLEGLASRLDDLAPVIEEQRALRREARAAELERAHHDKDALVDEAERIAEGNEWRLGGDRIRELLERWKSLPKLDKDVDDGLWRRFSSARTTYTRRRKVHYAERQEQQLAAKQTKRKLAAEAEQLASSTDWGPTAGRFRDLMRQWKAAGPAPRGDEEALWARFRQAQDTFFGARAAESAKADAELAANAETKLGILADAEALLPVQDIAAARAALRDINDRWERAGKVPRDRERELDGRLRAVEQAVREAEEERWQRSNPEARARAEATVAQLETSLTKLHTQRERAREAGDDRAAADATAAIDARESWLVEARRALTDFSP